MELLQTDSILPIYCDGYLKESIPVPTILAHTYTQVLWLSRRDSIFEATPSPSPRSSLTHEHRASETTPFPASINWSSGLSQGTTQTGAYVDVAHADVSLFIDRIPNFRIIPSFPAPISGNFYSKRVPVSWGASTPPFTPRPRTPHSHLHTVHRLS